MVCCPLDKEIKIEIEDIIIEYTPFFERLQRIKKCNNKKLERLFIEQEYNLN